MSIRHGGVRPDGPPTNPVPPSQRPLAATGGRIWVLLTREELEALEGLYALREDKSRAEAYGEELDVLERLLERVKENR